MTTYRVGIVGAGRRGERRGGACGIAEAHARGYVESGQAEIVVAAYESALRRGRVDLPLAVDYSPLARLVAALG